MTFTVYTFEVVAGQEWIFPVDEDHFEMFFAMNGKVISNWNPPVMKINHEERFYSDFPWLGEHVPFLRKPAVEALGHILLKYGQLLPVRGEEVWLFNATTALDALDHERSQIVYFDDGNILAIERHVFDRGRIGTAEVFKLSMRASPVFVTDSFVEQVRSAGLRGVSFKALWNSADL
ncbi:hypothetical protein SAMN05216412_107134 [Nitrosospira multiformis]|uniref:Immunity MXAN-0049 protein domain-containing protein n=1 Tax=Nitrosospira multiformis TaxID=1231 RepID=A0A1I0EZL4_9PROT|nr:DUF1629 domain-containing protein [Nitrosospira multiformis]SET50382.1 hypothetical protein SAMN05216412_107134 [Nitrosospira multiformis]